MAANRLLVIGFLLGATALVGCGDDDGGNNDQDSGPIRLDGGTLPDGRVIDGGTTEDADVTPDSGEEQRITLTGTVYEQSTGGGGFGPPVEGVTVHMLSVDLDEIDTATTDADGEYTIEAIANETHFIQVEGNEELWGVVRGERARGGNGSADPVVLQREADFTAVGASLDDEVVPDEETGWISIGFAPSDNLAQHEYADDPVRMYDSGDVGARLSTGPQPVIVNLTGPNVAEASETLVALDECNPKDVEACEEASLNRSEQIYMLNVPEDTDPGVTFEILDGGLDCAVRWTADAEPVRQGTITSWPVMARTLTSVSVDCME